MPTPEPTIPDAAARALSSAYHGNVYIFPDEAAEMLRAALPHLLPGLYVTHSPRSATIWHEGQPGYPEVLLSRTQDNAVPFDTMAALIPDRTEDEE